MKLNDLAARSIKVVLAVSLVSSYSSALTIDEYIQLAKQKNPLLKSYEASVEASKVKAQSSELDLSPVLTAGYQTSTDQSRPSMMGTKRESQVYNLGVAKKFTTGTMLKVQAQSGQFDNSNVSLQGFDHYSTGALSISLQQSLWKDFLGEGTQLKIDRQRKTAELEQYSNELQARAVLFEIEANYLDYALAFEDYKLKKANLDRAQKIDKWTANRVENGISDRADLMNSKALLALREAQLISAEEELKSQESKLRDNLNISADEKTPDIQADLASERPYLNVLKKAKHVQKIESYLSSLESEVKSLVASETQDSLKPDLNVFGTYALTSYNRDYAQAMQDVTKTDYPQSAVGLNLTWMFETEAKQSIRKASLIEAQASRLKADKKKLDGQTAWEDLVRKYEVLKKTVTTLDKAAQYQRERAKAEQDKLSKGRTVTANVVLAETDAAEAEVTLLRTKSQLRKLEASSLLFMEVQE